MTKCHFCGLSAPLTKTYFMGDFPVMACQECKDLNELGCKIFDQTKQTPKQWDILFERLAQKVQGLGRDVI